MPWGTPDTSKQARYFDALYESAKNVSDVYIEIKDNAEGGSAWRPRIHLDFNQLKNGEVLFADLFNSPDGFRGYYYQGPESGRSFMAKLIWRAICGLRWDRIYVNNELNDQREPYFFRTMLGVGGPYDFPSPSDEHSFHPSQRRPFSSLGIEDTELGHTPASLNRWEEVRARFIHLLLTGKLFPFINGVPLSEEWPAGLPRPERWFEPFDKQFKIFEHEARLSANTHEVLRDQTLEEHHVNRALNETYEFFNSHYFRERVIPRPGTTYWIINNNTAPSRSSHVTIIGTWSNGWLDDRKRLRSLSLHHFGFT